MVRQVTYTSKCYAVVDVGSARKLQHFKKKPSIASRISSSLKMRIIILSRAVGSAVSSAIRILRQLKFRAQGEHKPSTGQRQRIHYQPTAGSAKNRVGDVALVAVQPNLAPPRVPEVQYPFRNEPPRRQPTASTTQQRNMPSLPAVSTEPSSRTVQHSTLEVVELIRSYHQLNLAAAEIRQYLFEDGVLPEQVEEAFMRWEEEERALREAPSLPPHVERPVAVNTGQRGRMAHEWVMAKGNINQYTVGAEASCTLYCLQFLDSYRGPSTPNSLAVLIRNPRRRIVASDTEAVVKFFPQLRLLRVSSPIAPHQSPCLNAFLGVRYSVLSALQDAIGVDGSSGVVLTGQGISIAIKPDDGRFEIFDPHGDYRFTQSEGAYVYRCNTLDDVVNLLERKFPTPADTSMSMSVASAYDRLLQVWPIGRQGPG